MIALMYDGLELGTFYTDQNNHLKLNLHDKIQKSWLPYIFEIGIEADSDLNELIKLWKKERIFPKNRIGSKKMLKELNLRRYDIDKIAEITRCSVVTDPYWIVYKDTDRYYINSIRGQMGQSRYPYNSLQIMNEDGYIWRK